MSSDAAGERQGKSDKTILDRRKARVIPGTVVVVVAVVAAAVVVVDDNVVVSAVAVVVGKYDPVIRLDALAKALSVIIATATWLGGWVAGCPSHSGIVSKRLNLSENFFDHLKAPSF